MYIPHMENPQLITTLFFILILMSAAILAMIWRSNHRKHQSQSGFNDSDSESFNRIKIERDERIAECNRLRSKL
jgi:hypothetical protein